MIRIFILLAVCLATPVHALSCLRPDVVTLYERARDSADVYTIARGRILLSGPLATPEENSDEVALTYARFVGIALSGSGFDQVYLRDIVIENRCLSVWCGSLYEGELVVALRHDGSERRLALGPCGGDHMTITPDDEARLLTCHAGEVCLRQD